MWAHAPSIAAPVGHDRRFHGVTLHIGPRCLLSPCMALASIARRPILRESTTRYLEPTRTFGAHRILRRGKDSIRPPGPITSRTPYRGRDSNPLCTGWYRGLRQMPAGRPCPTLVPTESIVARRA